MLTRHTENAAAGHIWPTPAIDQAGICSSPLSWSYCWHFAWKRKSCSQSKTNSAIIHNKTVQL